MIVGVQTKESSRLRHQFNIGRFPNSKVEGHVRLEQQGRKMWVCLWQHFQSLLPIPKWHQRNPPPQRPQELLPCWAGWGDLLWNNDLRIRSWWGDEIMAVKLTRPRCCAYNCYLFGATFPYQQLVLFCVLQQDCQKTNNSASTTSHMARWRFPNKTVASLLTFGLLY